VIIWLGLYIFVITKTKTTNIMEKLFGVRVWGQGHSVIELKDQDDFDRFMGADSCAESVVLPDSEVDEFLAERGIGVEID
jgi:hypothetical protein